MRFALAWVVFCIVILLSVPVFFVVVGMFNFLRESFI